MTKERDNRQSGPRAEDEGIPDLEEEPLESKRRTGDPQEGIVPPKDRPQAVEGRTTPAEQREGPTLAQKLSREEPDRERPSEGPAGRLVEGHERGRDVTKELEAEDSDDDVALSAEEDAVHTEP